MRTNCAIPDPLPVPREEHSEWKELSLLRRVVRVALVGCIAGQLAHLRELLESHGLFTVVPWQPSSHDSCGTNVDEARAQVVLANTDKCGWSRDRSQSVASLAKHARVVAMVASPDVSEAVRACRLGAWDVVPADQCRAGDLHRAVFGAFVAHVLDPAQCTWRVPALSSAVRSLHRTAHDSVVAWVRDAGLTDEGLRKSWYRHMRSNRRDVLYLRKMLEAAYYVYAPHAPPIPGRLRPIHSDRLARNYSRYLRMLD